MRRINLILSLFILPALLATAAAQQPKKTAVADPADAPPCYALQGEYVGEIATNDGNLKLGAQIIALADGKFRAVGYHGGLPGAGWDQGEKHTADGELQDDGTVKFTAGKGTALLKDGLLTISNNEGNQLAQLKKVERKSPTLGAKPPEGAVVLFDGKTPEHFQGGRMTEDGLLMEGVTSKQKFGDFTLHLEFRTPYMPQARGQGRGNSGCYLQGRYEVQILDSFGLEGKNNECGGIYETRDPDVNMCLPPLAWQTYDIDYTAARFGADGKKTANARMTVRHNGVVVHDDVELPKATRAAPVKEGPEPGPVYLQNHGNPVRFRNIWVVEK